MTITVKKTKIETQLRDAGLFHALHTSGVLVLPNAWDAASARLAQEAGAKAIATTSAGTSWSLGAPDGERLPWREALGQLRRIVSSVTIPVSVDIEGGYADVQQTVSDVLEAGAVGINIEDGHDGALRTPEDMASRISLARQVAAEHGIPLFINARTDTHLLDVPGKDAEALRRARAYALAGADGVFVPGASDAPTVKALAEGIDVPLNVMAGPGSPSVSELKSLGVRRVSIGMSIAQAAYALVYRSATELLTEGTYESLRGGFDYGRLNALFG